jgi:Domain of unknown function DUF1828
MTIDCSNIAQLVNHVPLVRNCDRVRSGALRMSTAFYYPNGDYIDVFLERTLPLVDAYQLSDFGQTFVYLRDAQSPLGSTSRKREIIDDILSAHDVKISESDLYVVLKGDDLNDLSDAIMRLSQACVRISDFATHQRLRSSNSFRDDVEDFFDAHNLLYVQDVKVMGAHGKEVRIDFEVVSGKKHSYVNVLAALNEASAHASANEIFVKWYDLVLTGIMETRNLVTIYNSASPAIKEVDLARLRDYSSVLSYPEEQESIASILQDTDGRAESVEA